MKSSIQIVRQLSTAIGLAGVALVLAVPVAWGYGRPYRDAGDATAAKLALHSSPVVIRDAGDAAAAKLALRSSQAGYSTATPPPLETVKSGGFDWGDAGIGAASAIGLVLLACGLRLVVRMRNTLVHTHS